MGVPPKATPQIATRAMATVALLPQRLRPSVAMVNKPDTAISANPVPPGSRETTAVNTMPGMVIDADAGRPVLANKMGGVSGPALKPIALRCVAEIARAVKVPIIGTGGITTGRDAAEMIMAGAWAVGIGSAAWYRGPEVFTAIVSELAEWMQAAGYSSMEEMRGIAIQ